MDAYDTLLFLHLLAAFMMIGGALAYHILQFALLRRDRPSEVAALFGAGRLFVLLIQVGAVAVLIFGIWLAYVSTPEYGITDEWVIAVALGFFGGNLYTKAAQLAGRLEAEGADAPSAELRAMIRSPRAALMTWGSTVLIVAILVLMIWKPGAP